MKPYPPRTVVLGLLGLALSAGIFTACVQEPAKPSDTTPTNNATTNSSIDSTGNLKAQAGPSVGTAQWSTIYRPTQNHPVSSNQPFSILDDGFQTNSQVKYRLTEDVITRSGTYGSGDGFRHTTAYLQRVDANSDQFVGWYVDLNAARTTGRLGYFAMSRGGKNANVGGGWSGTFNVPSDTALTKQAVRVVQSGSKMLQENTQLEYKCVNENGRKKIQRFGLIGSNTASGELYETATPNVYAGWFLNTGSNDMGVLTLETDCVANKTWMFGWNYLPMASNVSGTFSTDANGIQQGSSLKFTQPANELHRTGTANAAQMLDVNGQGKVFSGWYAQNGQLGAFNVTKSTPPTPPIVQTILADGTSRLNVTAAGVSELINEIRLTANNMEATCIGSLEGQLKIVNDYRNLFDAKPYTLTADSRNKCTEIGKSAKVQTELSVTRINELFQNSCRTTGIILETNKQGVISSLRCNQ
jgi:hypothetical protein